MPKFRDGAVVRLPGPVKAALDDLALDFSVDLGRRVTYGEVIERAVEALRKEREGAR